MNPLNLDILITEWTNDSVINDTEFTKELKRIPSLHAKYASQLHSHSLASKMASIEYAKMKKLKIEYYNGRLDKAQLDALGWKPFLLNIKYDMQAYIDADTDLIKIHAGKVLHDEAVEFCKSVIKELNNRTWQLKTMSEWERFIAGQ